MSEWLDDMPIGFASPESNLSTREAHEKSELFRQIGVQYIRLGIRSANTFMERVERKITLISKSKRLFCRVYKDSLIAHTEKDILYSVPVVNTTSLEQVKALVEYCIKVNKNCVLMFHSILKPHEEYAKDIWSWDYGKFEKLCIFLRGLKNQGVVEVITSKELINEIG